MDALIQEPTQQVRDHTNRLRGMELYRIYTNFFKKDNKEGKVKMTSQLEKSNLIVMNYDFHYFCIL